MADNIFGAPPPGKKPPPVTLAAPVTPPPAPPPAAPAATAPSANDLILQHLGQGGIGSDAVVAPPPTTTAPSANDLLLNHLAMGSLNQDPEAAGMIPAGVPSGVRQFASDVAAARPADTSRPQTYYDWATRRYDPSLADAAKTMADAWSYGQAPTASWLAQKAGVPVPQSLSPEAINASTEQASRNLGPYSPVASAIGYATQPLNWFGLGPLADIGGAAVAKPLIKAATKYAPDVADTVSSWLPRAISGGTQASVLSAAKEQGLGGDPADILKSALTAFPTGGVISGVAGGRGGVTPADITASTAARNQALQEQLTKLYAQAGGNAQAQAQAAADALKTTPVGPEGFTIAGNKNPSIADALEHQQWLKTIKPSDEGAAAVPSMQQHVDQALNAPEVQPLIAQHAAATARAASYAANPNPLPSDLVGNQDWLKDLPSAGPTVAAASKAAQQAQVAPTMERWLYKLGYEDPRAEAGGMIVGKDQTPGPGQYQIGSPEAEALNTIAGVRTPPPERPLPPYARKVAIGGGTALGEGAAMGARYMGLPYVPPPGAAGGLGAQFGNTLIDAINFLRRPADLNTTIGGEIGRQYPAMTGQQGPTSGNDALARALIYLHQGMR